MNFSRKHPYKRRNFLRRSGKGGGSQEVALQITSLVDVFTILIVFLLKGIASGGISITPAKGILLPEAQAASSASEVLKIEVTSGSILVEGQPVVTLKNFALDPKDTGDSGSSKKLNETLKVHRSRVQQISAVNSSVQSDSRVLILADQDTPYKTLKGILASAAINGYSDFKLAVIRKGE